MAHEVETMFSVGETPWHGLGRILVNAPLTGADALREAGLNWTVSKVPLFLQDGTKHPEAFATVRDSDKRILGAVGKAYTVFQNHDAMWVLDQAVQDGRARYETAGSLRNGRTVWILTKVNAAFDVTKGDTVDTFALVTNSHDGSKAAQVRFTPIRVVCQNTLSAATASGASGRFISVRHTANVSARMAIAGETLGILRDQVAATAEVYRAMANVQMTAEKIRLYLTSLVPDNKNAESNVRTRNIRDRIMSLVETGRGADLPGVRGTLWGTYNAVTEYVDHERIPNAATARGGMTAKEADQRLDSVWFGAGELLKRQALTEAMALVQAA